MDEKRRPGRTFFRIIGGMIVGLVVIAACSLVIGAIVMVLWNWLMPSIFGLVTINYWQAFGIVLFAKLVFGGFGKHFGPPFAGRKWQERRWGEYAKHWDEYSKRWGEYAKNRGFKHSCHLEDDYEEWWKAEGLDSFEEYMKNRDEKDNKTEDKE